MVRMMRGWLFVLLSLVCVSSFSCANPSYLTVRSNIGNRTWSTIAVVPFAGDERFRDVATETFTLHILKQNKFLIIEPETVRVKASSITAMIQGNSMTVLEAQKIGQQVNADAVMIGTVTSYNNGMTLNGWATVKLVDTRSGEVLASTHKPSGLFFGYSEHQCVVAATKRAAEDMLGVIDQIQHNEDTTQIDHGHAIDMQPNSRLNQDQTNSITM